MAAFVPSSRCARILLDGSLFADAAELAAAAANLGPVLGGRALILLDERGLALSPETQAIFAETVLSPGIPFTQEQLAAACGDDTLLVTRQERFLAWARGQGIAVHTPGDPSRLGEQLGGGALVMRDTIALLLREKRRREARPLLIGVNGMDNSGKTVFAERLARQLEKLGFAPVSLSLDLFAAPKKIRRAKNYPEADGHYRKFYAWDRLRDQLLAPLQAGETTLEFDAYDLERERVSGKRKLVLDPSSFLILEGLYLYQEDLFTAFDFRVYLVTDFQHSLELELEGIEGAKASEKRREQFLRRELAAQSIYLKQANPWKRAHVVIRDVGGEHPLLESWRQEARDPDGAKT